MQLQQAQFTAIQVKQEYPTQNQMGTQNSIGNDLKHQMMDQGHPQLQQMQLIEAPSVSPHHAPNSASLGNSTTTISTMSPLQAIPTAHTDWGQSRLQLIQPSISNSGYLQHLYSPVIMSGNIIHSGIGQQPIQVIATNKQFSSGGPQMITAQNKQLLGANPTNFSGSYTLPGIPSSQSQALVFSPVSVINSQPQQQQQNILPTMNTQQNNGKQTQPEYQKSLQNQKMIQKVNTNNTITNTQSISGSNTNIHSTQQCVQVSQAMPTAQLLSPMQQAGAQSMQINPWMQGVPHFWTNSIQPQTLLAQNPIIIRGTQSDGTQGMFIQQATTQHAIQSQQANQQTLMQCNIPQTSKPKMQIEPINKTQQPRAPLILPQNTSANRPASNVSTQTAQNQNLFAQKQIKRNKQQTVRPALTVVKSDSPVQIKAGGMHQVAQQHSMHQVVTSGGNKMVVVSTGQPINIQSTGSIQQQNINSTDKQQMQMQQLKQQHQQTLIHQQQLQQQIMQQNPNQQLLQQQIAQIHLQQQSHQHLQSGIQGGAFLTQQQQNNLQQFATNHEQQRDQQHSGVLHQIVVQQNQQHQMPQISHVPSISTNNNVQPKHINIPVEKQKCNVNCQPPVNNSNISFLTSQTPIASNIICSESLIASSVTSTVSLPLSTTSNSINAMTTFTTSVLPTTTISTGITSSTSLKLGNPKLLDSSIKPEPNTLIEENYKEKIESNLKKSEQLNKEEEKSEGLIEKSHGENKNKESIKSITEEDKSKKDTAAQGDDKRAENENCTILSSDDTVTRSCVKIKNSLKSEKELPKAMIKPNVLTHVIEGFVIQEGSEPFSVTRVRYSEKDILEEPPNKRQALTEPTHNSEATTATCENCGKKELRSKLKRKRYCSSLCMRERKSFTEDDQNFDVTNSIEAIIKSNESIDGSTQNLDKPKPDLEQSNILVTNQEECPLMQWSVSDVCEFIKNLTGCNDYADDFAHQEIDGQALLLLKENHLVHAMGMKLGPALKIVAKVESMKEGNVEKETH